MLSLVWAFIVSIVIAYPQQKPNSIFYESNCYLDRFFGNLPQQLLHGRGSKPER
jgi:hypothetical protein